MLIWQVSHEHARQSLPKPERGAGLHDQAKERNASRGRSHHAHRRREQFSEPASAEATERASSQAAPLQDGTQPTTQHQSDGETIEKFLKTADDRHVPLGELLRLALDALEWGVAKQ